MKGHVTLFLTDIIQFKISVLTDTNVSQKTVF